MCQSHAAARRQAAASDSSSAQVRSDPIASVQRLLSLSLHTLLFLARAFHFGAFHRFLVLLHAPAHPSHPPNHTASALRCMQHSTAQQSKGKQRALPIDIFDVTVARRLLRFDASGGVLRHHILLALLLLLVTSAFVQLRNGLSLLTTPSHTHHQTESTQRNKRGQRVNNE